MRELMMLSQIGDMVAECKEVVHAGGMADWVKHSSL